MTNEGHTIAVGGLTFQLSKLTLRQARTLLLKLMSTGGDVQNISDDDFTLLQNMVWGQHCLYINEQGHGVPMTDAVAENVLNVKTLFELIQACIEYQTEDFLDDSQS